MQLRCEHSVRQHHTLNLLFFHNVSFGPRAYIRLHVTSDIRLHVGFTDAQFSSRLSGQVCPIHEFLLILTNSKACLIKKKKNQTNLEPTQPSVCEANVASSFERTPGNTQPNQVLIRAIGFKI